MVGGFLLERLTANEVEVAALSRVAHEPKPGVKWVTGDLDALQLDPNSQFHLAISLANIWLLPSALPDLYEAGVRRLVAVSSTSRYTKVRSAEASEREIVQRLIDAEDQTQAFCEARGIGWTILRPTIIYAEGLDRSITRIASVIRRFGFFPLSGRAEGKRQPVHADDLAAGVMAAAASSHTVNRAYNVPGGETISYREMCIRIFKGMGLRPRIVSLPPPLWRLGFAVGARFVPGATSAMGSRMDDDMTFDSAPAARDFDWNPRGFHPRF